VTRQERLRLFRPNVTLGRLDRIEQALVRQTMVQCRIQAESLRIQYERNAKPSGLILDRQIVRQVADHLALSMVGTLTQGRLSIREEIAEAKRTRYGGKPAVFAAIRRIVPEPGSEVFYPEAGINWYRGYSLRLAGVQQVDALEAAKQAVVRGVEEGLSSRKVMQELSDTFGDFSKNRLEMIARTETSKIYNQARWREMDGDSAIVGYEWSAILDSRVCPICAARAGRSFPKGQIEGSLPPVHVSCVLPGTRLEAPCGIVAGLRSWYDGQAVELTLSDGRRLAVTENHMLPTLYGFATAKNLRKGDYVFGSSDFQRGVSGHPDDNGQPAVVEEIISALSESFGMVSAGMPISAEDLHGDGRFIQGNVDIIASDGFLECIRKAKSGEHFGQYDFSPADVRTVRLSGHSSLVHNLFRWANALDSIMGGRREATSFLLRGLGHSEEHCFASIPQRNSDFLEPRCNHDALDVHAVRYCLDRLAGLICVNDGRNIYGNPSFYCSQHESFATGTARDSIFDQALSDRFAVDTQLLSDLIDGEAGTIEPLEIVNVDIFPYVGHVYDLQTLSSLYIANGILSSNCRCMLLPVFSWEIDEGTYEWTPIPQGAPQVPRGWGSTTMKIPPPRDKAVGKLIAA